jgi:hypothetical protein
MHASRSSVSHGVATSERAVHPLLGAVVCAAVVALAFVSLAVGLSGLLLPDPTGGLLRTLGGLAGFFVIFGLTLVAAARQT